VGVNFRKIQSSTGKIIHAQNSEESLIPSRLNTSLQFNHMLGSACWMGRSKHLERLAKIWFTVRAFFRIRVQVIE